MKKLVMIPVSILILINISLINLIADDHISNINNQNTQKLTINSDALSIDKEKNQIKFTENVVLTIDNNKIYTSKIIILYDKEDKNNKKIKTKAKTKNNTSSEDNLSDTITKAIIPEPLILINQEDDITIIADSAKYFKKEQKMILKGNIYLNDKKSFIKSNEFIILFE